MFPKIYSSHYHRSVSTWGLPSWMPMCGRGRCTERAGTRLLVATCHRSQLLSIIFPSPWQSLHQSLHWIWGQQQRFSPLVEPSLLLTGEKEHCTTYTICCLVSLHANRRSSYTSNSKWNAVFFYTEETLWNLICTFSIFDIIDKAFLKIYFAKNFEYLWNVFL